MISISSKKKKPKR